MTTPNPMSVVIEALERIDQKNYITGGGYYDLETRDLCAATLPLARSLIQEHAELVEAKEALSTITTVQSAENLAERSIQLIYNSPEDRDIAMQLIIKRYLEGK